MRFHRPLAILLFMILLLPSAGASSQSATPSDGSAQGTLVPGELIVRLSNGMLDPQQLTRSGLRALREIPALGLAIVSIPPGASESATAVDLESSGAVLWAEPNYVFTPDFIPNDPDYAVQTAYLSRLEMQSAWDIMRAGPDVVVAVLDTGVDLAHVDLSDAIWTNHGEIAANGLDDDENGFIDDVHGWDFANNDNIPDDDYGHGTHVAGIVAAGLNNGIGVAGVAGGVTLMPVDVFMGGIGTYEDLIRAIIYATDNGADVINMSLGASSYSRGEEMAVNYAYERGVVLVAAAGNQGRETYHYPAAHENAIAVAATNWDDTQSSFSNRGTWVDVAAPGTSILSTTRGNLYGYLSGTSMATPHVSGLAALIRSRNPSLTPAKVRELIQSTAEDLGAAGVDIVFGYGRVNARRALQQTPLRPPLDMDLPGCSEILVNGGFESGLSGWAAAGEVSSDSLQAYAGIQSARFSGGVNAGGSLTQNLAIPAPATSALIWFQYRIQTTDPGYGTDPARPYDDWFKAELTTPLGTPLIRLLETGNTADTSNSGLPWDSYIYRLEEKVLADLAVTPFMLAFTAQNDADTAPTHFWVDEVRFCFKPHQKYYFPLVGAP